MKVKFIIATLSDEAQRKFIIFHDELCSRKLEIMDDENRRGVLSKAKGQIARFAMVIHCLEQAIELPSSWSYIVDEDAVVRAKTIMDYLIEQKFTLMPPEKKIVLTSPMPQDIELPELNTGIEIIDDNPKYLNKFLSFKGTDIIPSDVNKYRLMPASQVGKKNKYPVEQCRYYMKEVSNAGFGEIINDTGNKRSLIFRKRSYDDMGEKQQDILKKININDYDSFMNTTDSSLGS